MRSRIWKLTGLPTAVMVFGLFAQAPSVLASPVINYTTSGQTPTVGITGAPVISFGSVMGSSFVSPSSFSLGNFEVAKLPDGQSTTYKDAPFSITLLVNSVDGTSPSPKEASLVVTGTLNGTLTGSNQSDVVAKFDPITKSNFVTGSFTNTLSIPDNPLTLVPWTTNNGHTSAQAVISSVMNSTPPASTGDTGTTPPPASTTVPEPSTIAIFLTAMAGLGVHRARRNRAA